MRANYGAREQVGLVLDVDRFSTHDGPGIRMVVFLKGCPLKCIWCHSPESQLHQPELLYQRARCVACYHCVSVCSEAVINPCSEGQGIVVSREACNRCFVCAKVCPRHALKIAGNEWTVGEIVDKAWRDSMYYQESGGGVTISGGEPLMQSDFVLELMRKLKKMSIHTAMETSGYGNTDALLKIARHTDLIYFDIKELDEARHKQHTGVSNALILRNLHALADIPNLRRRVCVRTPCIPGVNDSPEDIRSIAMFVKKLGYSYMEVLPYNNMAYAKYQWIGRPFPMGAIEGRGKSYMTMLRSMLHEDGLSAYQEGV